MEFKKFKNLKIEIFDNQKIDVEIVEIAFANNELCKDGLKNLNIAEDYFRLHNFKAGSILLDAQRGYIFAGTDGDNDLKTLISEVIRTLKKLNIKTALLKAQKDTKQVVLNSLLSYYEFNYKSKNSEISFETLCVADEINTNLSKEIIETTNIANSINLARDLVNTMPDVATAKYIAKISEEEAKKLNLEIKVYEKDFLKKEKMEAFLAVNRASVNDPILIHMAYKPKDASKKVVLVGKGLTYDSGGLSLKPANSMVTMKSDKSGACNVLGIIKAAASLGLNVEIHAVMGMAENMIGGNAYKVDDILLSREGKSIEVRNTDAEGRLVLADCLSFAQDLNPDILIDMATLTGACVVGLGDYTSGVMGFDESLVDRFIASASTSGDLLNKLTFNKHIRKLIDSKIADLSNTGGRSGGAISAGMFLGEFIRDEYKNKWIHIDIAGPAYVEEIWDVNYYGASGAGIRAVLEFIKTLEK